MMKFRNGLLHRTHRHGFTVFPISGSNLTLVRRYVNSTEGDYLSDV